MMAGRYAPAKQFNRHRRHLRLLRTRLGRIIRDIRRKIGGEADLEAVFEWPLTRANQIRSPAAAPARLEALFLPRSRGRVHRQRQGQRPLRIRRQGLRRVFTSGQKRGVFGVGLVVPHPDSAHTSLHDPVSALKSAC
jgi:predicted exporter